jgi:hypothetical protein
MFLRNFSFDKIATSMLVIFTARNSGTEAFGRSAAMLYQSFFKPETGMVGAAQKQIISSFRNYVGVDYRGDLPAMMYIGEFLLSKNCPTHSLNGNSLRTYLALRNSIPRKIYSQFAISMKRL